MSPFAQGKQCENLLQGDRTRIFKPFSIPWFFWWRYALDDCKSDPQCHQLLLHLSPGVVFWHYHLLCKHRELDNTLGFILVVIKPFLFGYDTVVICIYLLKQLLPFFFPIVSIELLSGQITTAVCVDLIELRTAAQINKDRLRD